jgi:hypothetical protein
MDRGSRVWAHVEGREVHDQTKTAAVGIVNVAMNADFQARLRRLGNAGVGTEFI